MHQMQTIVTVTPRGERERVMLCCVHQYINISSALRARLCVDHSSGVTAGDSRGFSCDYICSYLYSTMCNVITDLAAEASGCIQGQQQQPWPKQLLLQRTCAS